MWVCQQLRLDPGVYFTDTDPERQLARDAAATVIYDQERAEQARTKNN